MAGQRLELRALLQIDRLQPQFAAYTGATVQGSIPLAGDTILVGEMGPGNEVFRVIDVALKAADIQATSQIVEREFGFFILRSSLTSEMDAARIAVLDHLGMALDERTKPSVESSQIITSVEPYQAQLLNKWRKGALVVPGETLGIIECAPAAYVAVAANEAEKAATIKIVEVRTVGRFGRLFISGTESEVDRAVATGVDVINSISGRDAGRR